MITIITLALLFAGLTEDVQSNYCKDAPECYPVNERGEILEFGSNLEIPDNSWSVYPAISHHSVEQVSYLRYAYEISQDEDFVLTLKKECGEVSPTCKSYKIGANGHWDYGLCQLNYQWHQPFIDSEDFKDPYKQIDYCWKIYEGYKKRGIIGKRFYAYNVRHLVKHFFKFN